MIKDDGITQIDEDGIRQRWERVGSKLDERGRRLWAAGEVQAAGHGALKLVSRILAATICGVISPRQRRSPRRGSRPRLTAGRIGSRPGGAASRPARDAARRACGPSATA